MKKNNTKTISSRYFGEYEHWIKFTTVKGLCQETGLLDNELPKLVIKELLDNTFDEANECKFIYEYKEDEKGPNSP